MSGARFNSPIETMLDRALIALLPKHEWILPADGTSADEIIEMAADINKYVICKQVKINRYRLDFFIATPAGQQFAIECDGHAFHDKTKEQAQQDRWRDRRLLQCGVVTMRFTGSEIWSDAKGVADEILDVVRMHDYLGDLTAQARNNRLMKSGGAI